MRRRRVTYQVLTWQNRTVDFCLIGSTSARAKGLRVSAGDGDCPQDGTYGPFGDEASRVLVILIIARRAGAAATQVGPPFLFMAPKDGTHDDTRFTITPPPPVLRATIRSEAVQWEVSLDRTPQGHDHRHCSVLPRECRCAGCRATSSNRPQVRHASESLGRDCARIGHAGGGIGSAVATRCVGGRPRRGTASTGTWRSDEDDQSSWHAGRSRRSRPCVPRNYWARSPGKPGPGGSDRPRGLTEGRPTGTSATEPVWRIRRRHRTCPHRAQGSSGTSGRREPTRGQALVRSSRRPRWTPPPCEHRPLSPFPCKPGRS